jgi:TIR domain
MEGRDLMDRDDRRRAKGEAKKAGQAAAKQWCRAASHQAQVTLAGWGFEYGMTLHDLIAGGARVPPSADEDYSWGFFKLVKSRVYHALHKSTLAATQKAAAAARTHVFVSYSHRDVEWLNRLQTHMKPLIRAGIIDLWDDTRINPGFDWRREINEALAMAQVAVLIVSADFLASEFIWDNELPPPLERATSGGARVLSLIVRPCLYAQHTALSKYQAVNDPRHPLSSLPEHRMEAVLVRLAEQICESVGSSLPRL